MIRAGQVYQSVKEPKRKIVVLERKVEVHLSRGWVLYDAVRVATVLPNERRLRERTLRVRQLHASAKTMRGEDRRTGYVLVRGVNDQ